jgi:hypothetical protein
LLLLFPEKQKTKARLVAAARERSLVRSSKRWHARNEQQTKRLACSPPSRERHFKAPAAAATAALPPCNHTTHIYGGRFLGG